MKLVRWMSGACAAVAVASLLGCSSSAGAPKAPTPALDARVATTELMSARLAAPAPRVGKTHRVLDDASAGSDLGAPKDGRPSDGSRCAGHFGALK
jgi:hypothetical protein